jgi:dUTPase
MKFEVIKNCPYGEINLPKRATKNAAGYDFECAADTTI